MTRPSSQHQAPGHTPRLSDTLSYLAALGLVLGGLLLVPHHDAVAGKSQRFGPHVYLTWRTTDTTTTMTVNYHTWNDFEFSQVYFDTVPREGEPAAYLFRRFGEAAGVPGAPKRFVHAVHLTDLAPGTTYYFIVGDATTGFSEERSFRTIPADGRPIRLAIGGDVSNYAPAWKMAKRIAAEAPDAVMIGGDIAYANGGNYLLWDKWLRRWDQRMIAPDGRTIPVILAVGNHELGGRPYWQRLFDQGGQSYFVRTFGPDVACVILDTGNIVPHGGKQTRWLRETLEVHADYPVKLAMYHHPLYPAYEPFTLRASAAGRRYWLPLFDGFRLTAGFEHHDHVYKRTELLRGGRVADGGSLYIGGGAWGMPPRPPRAEPYLRRAKRTRNVVIADVSADAIEYRAIGTNGKTFDAFVQTLD
jgi:hypothetical protein